MSTLAIKEILNKYLHKIDHLDLELLIAAAINKSREFVLAHPEYEIPVTHNLKLETLIKRRMNNEPFAYILGQKEFYGLDFKANKHVLIPRPETELIPQLVTQNLKLEARSKTPLIKNTIIIDIGTGSGNIIISIVKNLQGCGLRTMGYRFYAIDISAAALKIAKQNSKFHKVDKKIKFLKGNLLTPILKNTKYHIPNTKYVILANLPYLSKNIYASAPASVRKFEPRSALLSRDNGLAHYERLLKQIKNSKKMCFMLHATCFLEISPEQKTALRNLIKKALPGAKIAFYRDLAGRWRVCKIML